MSIQNVVGKNLQGHTSIISCLSDIQGKGVRAGSENF